MGAMPKTKRRSNSCNGSSVDGRRMKSKHKQQMQQQQSQNLEDDVHEAKANGLSSSSKQQQRYHHHHRLPHHSHHHGSGVSGGGDNGGSSNGIRGSSRFSNLLLDNNHNLTNNNNNGKQQHHPLSNSQTNSRNSHNNPNNNSSHNNNNNNNNPHQNRRKALDPTLLARGMSSRSIGARISSQVRSLSLEEMEKDVRHMEVFGTACIAYAQQFFIYTNRESVSRGVYGPVPSPSPGLLAHHPGSGVGDSERGILEGEDGGVIGEDGSRVTEDTDVKMEGTNGASIHNADKYPPHTITPSPTLSTISTKSKKLKHSQIPPGGGITMPVRIDPEEEKRLSILRKRVAASEAKREVLETEYLSLRAHYVHESHLLRHARRNTDGQLGLLKELGRRRGEVLALRRVRVAIGSEILEVMKYRKINGCGGGDGVVNDDGVKKGEGEGTAISSLYPATNTDTTTTTPTTTTNANEEITFNKVPEDLIDIWTSIEARLHEAELACSEVDTPKELFLVKSSLSTAVAAARNNSGGTNSTSGSSTIVTTTTSGSSSDKTNHQHTSSNSNKVSSSSNNVTTGSNAASSISGDNDSLKNPSLSSQQHSSSSLQHTHPRRSRSPLRPKDSKQQQHSHDQDNDNDGSGSGSSSNNGSNLTKKKGGKGENSKQQYAKGSNAGNQSSGTTSLGGGENHTNNNTNNKSSSSKSNKRATSNINTDTVAEESSPSPEGGGDVLMGSGSSTTDVASITTTNSSKTKNKKKQSSSSYNNNVNGDHEDDNVIPWSCQTMPRTPYDVSVFISNLSSVPDGSAAFGCGTMFGNDDSSMIWLESNIPRPSSPHTSAKMRSESQNLLRLRREVRDLSKKLDGDVTKNRDLQNDLIANRKRSDELSAMVSMLRTETEAVLNRHNGILETPEARASAVALLHAKTIGKAEAGDGIEEEDGTLDSNSDEDDEDEDDMDDDDDEELDEKDKSSDGGTVIEDEEGEAGGLALYDAEATTGSKDILTDPGDSVEEGEIHEEGVRMVTNSDFEDEIGEDEEDEEGFDDTVHQHQPMKEVIVPRLSSGGDEVEGEGESAVVDEEDGEINEDYSTATGFEAGKRCFSEVSDGGSAEVDITPSSFLENDPDKKRRRV